MEEIAIVGAARTPIGRFMGALSTLSAPRLAATAIRGALDRAGISPEEVEEAIIGQVLGAGVGMGPARQAAIAAGIPASASAFSLNKVCASGLTATILAGLEVTTGAYQVAVAGGMESMSQAPHLLKSARWGVRLGSAELADAAVHDGLWCAWNNHHMGNSAELIARKYGISRQQQDEFALNSHRKAIAAIDAGRFKAEIVPVPVQVKKTTSNVDTDETPRRDTSLEALARLSPAFEANGTVTAGNAPGLSDGAAALVVTSARLARERGWPIRARLTGHASGNLDPLWVFDAPVEAVGRLLKTTGLSISDFDLIEVNEAFSAQVLANGKVLGWDWDRVNIKGGGVALGHPIGCSGARILVTLLHSLEELGLHRGLAVLCHGGGGAVAVSIEV